MKQIIILNAPPRSGKDELAKYLAQKHTHFHQFSFADELKKLAHRLYNTPDQAPEAYEAFKDQPMTEFMGLTPRQAYTRLAEDYIKPNHGKDFFGLQLILTIKAIKHHDDNVFVISDGGFVEELEPLLMNFDPHLFTIVQLYRQGCTFDNDSRHYFSAERFSKLGVKFLKLDNNNRDVETHVKDGEARLLELIPGLYGESVVNNVLNNVLNC